MNGALYLKEEIKYIAYYVNKFRYLQFVFIPMTYSQIIAFLLDSTTYEYSY